MHKYPIQPIIDLQVLPLTSNADLSYLNRPKRLTLEEFRELVVSGEEAILRQKIYDFEEFICTLPNSYTDKECPFKPVHSVTGGIYVRTLAIPPHQVVIGYRHAIEHEVMLAKGSCICVTERGLERMVAPVKFTSPAGEKRIVVTEDEDAVWITIHRTDETEIDKIEADILINEPERRKFQIEQRALNRLALENEQREMILCQQFGEE